MSKVFIIGGGAAGMIAAIAAAGNGNEVHLLEKNEKLGKKLFITGKGRCNVTNASDIATHFNNIVRNPKFLYSAYNVFDSEDIMDLIESAGVKLKVERGMRVFPESDKSSDIIWALKKKMEEFGVSIHYHCEVKNITQEEGICIELVNKKKYYADACIIATGGFSYQTTGSTGDGYEFARKLGHEVTQLYPSLVPFNIKEEFYKQLQGLSLKNVQLTILKEENSEGQESSEQSNGKKVYSDMGEMLFTHFGISGPLVLTASSMIADDLKNTEYKAVIDLKPALTAEQLDKRIVRDFEESLNKNFKNSIDSLLPKKLVPVIIELSQIPPEQKVNEITKEQRQKLVHLLKNLTMTISSVRGYNEAIITKGGVSIKEINPRTMESKIVPSVYFAGEVLDIDAFTGGYNLQVAWSTGYLAGSSIY